MYKSLRPLSRQFTVTNRQCRCIGSVTRAGVKGTGVVHLAPKTEAFDTCRYSYVQNVNGCQIPTTRSRDPWPYSV
jgi:hypothetical protein